MISRKTITERMKVQSLLCWNSIVCPECGERIYWEQEYDWDHRHALVHDGQHHFSNIRIIHRECHKAKTARDIKANAKVKRIIAKRDGKPKPKRRRPSRPMGKGKGFPPKGSRKMNWRKP